MEKKNWEVYFNALKNQDWNSARESLDAIAKKERDNPQVYLKMGDVCQRAGDTAGAISSYHRSARMLKSRGFNQKAVALYKIILRLDPHDPEAVNQSAEIVREIETARSPLSPDLPVNAISDSSVEVVNPPEPAVAPAATAEGEWLKATSYSAPQGLPEGKGEALDIPQAPPASKQSDAGKVPALFSGMREDEFRNILEGLEKKVFRDSERVIEEGDSGDSMYLIESGRAKVVAHLLGKEVELAALGEGDVFGEVAFLTGRPRTANVIADGPLRVYEIGRFDIERIIEADATVLSRLEEFFESRVRDTIKKVRPG